MGLREYLDKRRKEKLEKIRKTQFGLSILTGEIKCKTIAPERIDDAFKDLVRYGKIREEVEKFLKSVLENYGEEPNSLADEFKLYCEALTKLEDKLLPVEEVRY